MSQPQKRLTPEDQWRIARTVQCPICDAAPKWPCRSNLSPDGRTLPKGEEHGYRLAVAHETALNNMLVASRKAALDEVQTLLSRIQYEDLTASEAIALVAVLRPIHERVTRELMSGRLRLVGDIK